MSSLIEAYHSKIDVLYQEREAIKDLYEQAIMNYITSDKAHQRMKEVITNFFFSTVIYLSQRDNSVVAYESDYESGFDWSIEECGRIFGKYGKVVNSLLTYVDMCRSDKGHSYNVFFEVGITAGEKAYVDFVVEELEYHDHLSYIQEYCITRYGYIAKDNFIKLIQKDIQEILFQALQKDYDILYCMNINGDFCEYLEDKYGIDLDEIDDEEFNSKMPKHLHSKTNNLWDIYLEFLSTTESKGE